MTAKAVFALGNIPCHSITGNESPIKISILMGLSSYIDGFILLLSQSFTLRNASEYARTTAKQKTGR